MSVCARTAGRAIAVVALSPQRTANQPVARSAVGEGDVCVASVCVTTSNPPETSARDILHAKAPANHTGTCHSLFQQKHKA